MIIMSSKIVLWMGKRKELGKWNYSMFNNYSYQSIHTIHWSHFSVLGFSFILSIHFYSFSFSHSILISSFLYEYSIFYYDIDIVDFKRNRIIEMKLDDMNRTQFPIWFYYSKESIFDRCCWIHFNRLMSDMNEYTNKNEKWWNHKNEKWSEINCFHFICLSEWLVIS